MKTTTPRRPGQGYIDGWYFVHQNPSTEDNYDRLRGGHWAPNSAPARHWVRIDEVADGKPYGEQEIIGARIIIDDGASGRGLMLYGFASPETAVRHYEQNMLALHRMLVDVSW